MLELGIKVEDVTSGVTGILIARCCHLGGHVECSVKRVENGSGNIIIDWIPEVYLRKVDDGIVVENTKEEMGFKCTS